MFENLKSNREPTKILSMLLITAVLGVAVFVLGYYSATKRVSVIANVFDRIDRKISKFRGEPSETERMVAQIETAFLRLQGKVIPVPVKRTGRGGGMTL